MLSRMLIAAAALAVAAPPSHAAAGSNEIGGKVTLEGSGNQRVMAGEVADTLVYFVPAVGVAVKPSKYTIYTHNRDFNPGAMAVPLGSTVDFVNQDDVRHNVFSVTPGSPFNLGFQGNGDKASYTFTRPGLVLIGCNVHRSMETDVFVVPSPYTTHANADGTFRLSGLPDGPGKVYFWNARGTFVTQSVTLPLAAPIIQKIAINKPRVPVELNLVSNP